MQKVMLIFLLWLDFFDNKKQLMTLKKGNDLDIPFSILNVEDITADLKEKSPGVTFLHESLCFHKGIGSGNDEGAHCISSVCMLKRMDDGKVMITKFYIPHGYRPGDEIENPEQFLLNLKKRDDFTPAVYVNGNQESFLHTTTKDEKSETTHLYEEHTSIDERVITLGMNKEFALEYYPKDEAWVNDKYFPTDNRMTFSYTVSENEYDVSAFASSDNEYNPGSKTAEEFITEDDSSKSEWTKLSITSVVMGGLLYVAYQSLALASSYRTSTYTKKQQVKQMKNAVFLTTKVEEGEGEEEQGEKEEAYDIFRDSPLRYMGYANEIGEAFVAWLPPFGVPASYGVAAVYVFMDTTDKGIKRWKETSGDAKLTGATTMDTLLWQLLASVFWPGSFIRVVVATTNFVLSKTDIAVFHQLAEQGIDMERILPTLLGIAVIPFIVHPIDTTVEKAGDISFSKALKGEMKTSSDWATGAAVITGCLALPPVLFSIAAQINNMAG